MTQVPLQRRVTGANRAGRTNAVPIAEDLDEADLDVAPPAYGEHHDQLQFSQAGFNADAAVTTEGRVNIHINEKNHRLSELLASTLSRPLEPAGPLPPAYIPPSLGGQPGQTPPPRLNVVIQIVGSRGDVQPFVALGQVLRDTYGHRVRLATHANFRSFVEENGLEFFNIGGDPAQLMAFMVKNPGLMPGLDTLKSGDIKRRRLEIEQILVGCWRSCIEAGDGMGVAPPQHKRDEPLDERFVLPGDPGVRPFVADAIIANPPSFAHVHIAEKLGIPLHMMFTMPWTPTKAFPHPLADVVAADTDAAITNYVSYALVEMMTWQGLGDVINRFRVSVLELESLSLMWAPGLLNRLRIPATYCWSPALTPKPADWAPEITVSGFYFLNLESNYTPDPELAAFLAAGPPPVYIGFGSIVVDDPDRLTQTIFQAILKSGVRAIVSKGWGGIGGDAAGVPEGVFMLGNCPHDWLFKHVSAVVHHGGAGTTAAGIMAGQPTVVVPFFGDQIFWGSMVAKAGAGPAPIPYKKLTAETLAAAIEHAVLPQTQARARELGAKIKQEKGADVGGKSFHQFLNTDNMRCSLAPSRVAVWRVRRSKVRLSTLATAVLVKQGLLKYTDLKLYRPIEYNTEDQPWDPISAVASALIGDVGAFTMAVADFPREVFKTGKKAKEKADDTKDESAKADDAASGSDSSSQRRAPTHSATPSLASPSIAHDSVESLSIQSPAVGPSTALSSHPLGTSHSSRPSTSATSSAPPPRSTSTPDPGSASTPTASTPNLDVAIAAGKGVGRIVGAGMKFYGNTCMGLARGFRNAPKLYNDDTVRPPEKVTGLVSGMRIAGKEFGLGLYDGTSGLFTQPWKGAEKEGGKGFVKGVGKGIGGFFLKNAGAIFAIPAYTVQGIRAEVRGMFARSSMNYIITSRVLQGEEDWGMAMAEERADVLARWQTIKDDLKGFYLLKQRESEKGKGVAVDDAPGDQQQLWEGGSEGARSGLLNLPRGPWNRRRAGSSATSNSATTATTAAGSSSYFPPTTASSASSNFTFEDRESLERAIQQSVVQTSTGDQAEDARVEAAVRASVMEMRRAMEQPQPSPGATGQGPSFSGWIADQKINPATAAAASEAGALTDEEWTNISDEEYQALIEEAVRQSIQQQEMDQNQKYWFPGGGESQSQSQTEQGQFELPAAAELPGYIPFFPPATTPATTTTTTTEGNTCRSNEAETRPGDGNDDDEEQLRLAMEESEREHRSREQEAERQRTEEEIVLEYVKRQSLAEAEYRKSRAGTGTTSLGVGAGGGAEKGKAAEAEAGLAEEGVTEGGEEEDEELRRAIEESLKMSGDGSGAGPSKAGW
ncbi:hypothetical protein F5144DRAFT_543338 [Chaetomium tenue]|uniref:Uncharacterized protein n=1 Tax=Chaetomium tenue TaxID=1854479 RepID=A0ACB7PPI0_9PEZI|nr:hypothetical protein F5144DRAFT_543338 [Chaetomium globosum]